MQQSQGHHFHYLLIKGKSDVILSMEWYLYQKTILALSYAVPAGSRDVTVVFQFISKCTVLYSSCYQIAYLKVIVKYNVPTHSRSPASEQFRTHSITKPSSLLVTYGCVVRGIKSFHGCEACNLVTLQCILNLFYGCPNCKRNVFSTTKNLPALCNF